MANATCIIDGCGRIVGPKGAKGRCPKHYAAYRAENAPPCSVDGCDKRSQTRGLCPMHYQRWRARGDVGSAAMERQPNIGQCSVDGCDEPMRKREWCAGHYAHWRRRGDVNVPFKYKWYGDDITYGHAHKRVRNARGAPSDHQCVDCGGQAVEWSYDHADPDERLDDRGVAFSLKPQHYLPRCVRCHRVADGNPIAVKRKP